MIENILLIIFFQLFTIFFINKFSHKYKLYDYPSKRKIHFNPTPYTGGLIISLTFLFIIFISNFNELNILLVTCFVVSLFGFIDDKYELNFLSKIILQLLPTCYLIFNKFIIKDLGYYSFGIINLGPLAELFTILAVLLFINANNYNDGIDGLCTLTCIAIILAFSFFIFLFSDYQISLFLLILTIPLILFTIFNFGFYKFKFFLGDSGSNMLGFFIAFLTIFLYTEKGMHPALLIWPLAYLVFEFLTTGLLRLKKKNHIIKAGFDHFHYDLLNITKSNVYLTNFIIFSINIIFSLIGLLIFFNFDKIISLLSFVLSFIVYFMFRLHIISLKLIIKKY